MLGPCLAVEVAGVLAVDCVYTLAEYCAYTLASLARRVRVRSRELKLITVCARVGYNTS